MKKVDVSIQFLTKETNQECTVSGTYDEKNQILRFQEEDQQQTKVMIDFPRQKMIRKNKEYTLTIPFDSKKETSAKIRIEEAKEEMPIRIMTEKFQYENQTFQLVYQVIETQEQIEYRIHF